LLRFGLFFTHDQIDLKQNFALLERAVATIESRFITRVLRTIASIRKRLNASVLSQAIQLAFPRGQQIGSVFKRVAIWMKMIQRQ